MSREILRNRARCRLCGTILESRHAQDLQTCNCGAVSVDGGREYLRRLGRREDREDLSEFGDELGESTVPAWLGNPLKPTTC